MTTVNSTRTELNYISSIIDVQFTYSDTPEPLITYDNTPAKYGWDGWFDGRNIFILPEFKYQSYLFLHEVGHWLGLAHHGSNLRDTLMIAGDSGFTKAEADRITKYTHSDILDLWALHGVSTSYTGDIIGDYRNNTLFGGTGISDPFDNSEVLKGMQGTDVIYGNGGDDTIFGGTGTYDPSDSADTILGGLGNDLIYGNGGDDIINGGTGYDVIYGGAGRDLFYVDRYDAIMDFQEGYDTLIFI